MAQKDPTTVANAWATRLGQSTQKITDGINAVSTAPGLAAAKQKQVWVNNVAASQAKWAANVAAVDLGTWQQAAINKGVPRIASGATAAVPKMQAFLTNFLPYVENARNGLPPRGDLNANITRMTQFVTKMAAYKK